MHRSQAEASGLDLKLDRPEGAHIPVSSGCAIQAFCWPQQLLWGILSRSSVLTTLGVGFICSAVMCTGAYPVLPYWCNRDGTTYLAEDMLFDAHNYVIKNLLCFINLLIQLLRSLIVKQGRLKNFFSFDPDCVVHSNLMLILVKKGAQFNSGNTVPEKCE